MSSARRGESESMRNCPAPALRSNCRQTTALGEISSNAEITRISWARMNELEIFQITARIKSEGNECSAAMRAERKKSNNLLFKYNSKRELHHQHQQIPLSCLQRFHLRVRLFFLSLCPALHFSFKIAMPFLPDYYSYYYYHLAAI